MNSNKINFLYSIVEAFNIAQESLKVAKQIVKNPSKYQRSVLEKMPTLTTSSAPQNLLNDSLREIEDLFVLNLWATFERWLRDYLQEKGNTLETTKPGELGLQLYQHFAKEVEYWKPEDMLDILKDSIFANSQKNKDLVGHAKQILKYRNWIAHGRNPREQPPNIVPNTAYNTLSTIINLVCATELYGK